MPWDYKAWLKTLRIRKYLAFNDDYNDTLTNVRCVDRLENVKVCHYRVGYGIIYKGNSNMSTEA